jgi:hypothetical protein
MVRYTNSSNPVPSAASGIVQLLEDGPVVYGIGFRLGSQPRGQEQIEQKMAGCFHLYCTEILSLVWLWERGGHSFTGPISSTKLPSGS